MNRAFLTFLAFLAIIATGHAATNFVTTTGAGDGSGSSWANASLLTNALAVVSDGDQIWIAAGTYTDTNQFEVQANNVTLYGGFTIGMTSLATRDWVANPVLLDGQGLRRVMVISNNVTLDGLVITNGNASGGAGLYMRGMHTVAVHNCHVVDNRISSGTAEGPGAYFYNGSVIISNTVFAGNKSQPPASHNNGQGFYAYNVALEIRDCIFTNNGPVPGSATYAIRCASGGAAYIDQGSLLVEDSVFVDNVSPSDCSGSAGGGAMFIRNCPSEIRRCVFTRNIVNEYVNYDAEHGGALWLNVGAGAATIEHCIFDRNRTGTHTGRLGGGVYVGGGNVTVSNCTFAGNSTSGEGGAIAVNGGALTLVNTILYTNAAAVRANDIVVKAGSATVSYCRLDGTEDLVNIYDPLGGLTLSSVMTNDPLFADAAGGDFHLQSPSGRWDSGLQAFVTSDSAPHSSCIDAGDPAHDASSEVVANGNRINMGRYGGTAQASRSPGNAPIIQNGPAVVTGNVAVVDGVLINNDTIADVALYYDTNPGITGADMSVALFPPQQTGTLFQADLAGLAYATTYYYRWYATNGYGHNFAAAESSFTTGAKSAGGPDGVIHVKPGSTGGQTGDNWFNAFGSVADAMAVVDDATNEVWVAAGTYDDATVEIDRACDIFGGFSGTETNRSQRDIQANPTILDGVGLRRIMSITSNAVLDGLIISNGNWTSGAGIYKTGDNTLAIRNCRIVSNRCTGGPGIGARLVSGTVTISNTVFAFNYGQADGQGLYANGVDLTVQYCTFTNNGPEPGLPAYVVRCRSGGGMFIQGGSLDVTDSLFIDNVSPSDCGAENGGGAIHIKSASSVLISGTDFVRNTVAEHGTYNNKNGGALWIDVGTSTARVDHCTFINNLTGTGPQDDGGALYLEDGYLTVSNCTFSGNRCSTEGGAIAVSGGNLFLVNSILYTNSAGVQASDIALTGGTITGTWCRLDGTTPSNHVYDAVGGLTLLNIITDDPLFVGGTDVHLKSRGGHWDTAMQTFAKDSVTSPCIDAGDPTSGYSREPVPNGRRINLGAYGNTPEASWQPNTGFILEIR